MTTAANKATNFNEETLTGSTTQLLFIWLLVIEAVQEVNQKLDSIKHDFPMVKGDVVA